MYKDTTNQKPIKVKYISTFYLLIYSPNLDLKNTKTTSFGIPCNTKPKLRINHKNTGELYGDSFK